MSNPTLPSQTPIAPTAFQFPPTLTQIQTKVRRLTRTPSTAQLTDQDLNNYINTAVVYDFPEELRTFNLRKPFTFYTTPGQDVYDTDIASFAGATGNALYNFQNLYITVHTPVYIAGFEAFYTQNREQFFGIYPKVNNILFTGLTGNGTAGPYTGVINSTNISPIPLNTTNQLLGLLQNQVLLDSIGTHGAGEHFGVSMVDVPIVDGATGYNIQSGNLYDPNSAAYQAAVANPPTVIDPANNINYLTGVFTVTFSSQVVNGFPINSQSVPTNLALPSAMLFYNNQFTLRPVPDQPYRIEFEVYQRPTALLATGQTPELEEYWQYVALSASRLIFQDRMDTDSVAQILPELKRQERLCLRRTLIQYTNERTATIYTEQTAGLYGAGWFAGGGQF